MRSSSVMGPSKGEDLNKVVIIHGRSTAMRPCAPARKGCGFGIDFEPRLVFRGHVIAAVMLGGQLQIHSRGVTICRLVFNPEIRKTHLSLDDLKTVLAG